MVYDLIVVGAGPAGSSAAITAARSGARVLLLEKGSFPRQRVCGEFVSAESLGLLSNLLDSSHAHVLHDALRISHARMFLDGHRLDAPVNPPAASIMRLDLDWALWQSARLCGATALDQMRVREIKPSANGELFHVALADAVFESKSVIQCCGRWSNLNAGAPNAVSAGKWLGLKAHFEERQPSGSGDLHSFEAGYCGGQPVSAPHADGWTRVNACAMVRADVATTLEQVLSLSGPLAHRSRSWRRVGQPVTTAPLVFRPPEPLHGKVLQAGDAAAFVDPFAGDGISLALRSGAMVTESLMPFLRGAVSLAQAARHYRAAYERRLRPVFRNSARIRRLLAWPKMVRLPLLHALEASPTLARWMVQKTR